MVAVRTWRQAVGVLLWLKQPALTLPLRELERDADTAFDFPQHRVVKAAEVEKLDVRAPRSIFDMADAMKAAKDLQRRGRFGEASGFVPSAPSPTVLREGGVVRVVGAQYPANRWTEEREEQERARRARQKPPRPVKKAKTRSKKLLELIGEGHHDD